MSILFFCTYHLACIGWISILCKMNLGSHFSRICKDRYSKQLKKVVVLDIHLAFLEVPLCLSLGLMR